MLNQQNAPTVAQRQPLQKQKLQRMSYRAISSDSDSTIPILPRYTSPNRLLPKTPTIQMTLPAQTINRKSQQSLNRADHNRQTARTIKAQTTMISSNLKLKISTRPKSTRKLPRHADAGPKVANVAGAVADDPLSSSPQETIQQVLRIQHRHLVQMATMKIGLLEAEDAAEVVDEGGITKTEIKKIRSSPNRTISIYNRQTQ